jgi:hypothetical protein
MCALPQIMVSQRLLTLMHADLRVGKVSVFAFISFLALIAIFFSSQRLRFETSRDVTDNSLASQEDSSQQDVYPLGKTIKGNKVAVIIETRPLDSLVPLILHFSAVLGPEWPIVFFTEPSLPPAFKSAPFVRLINAGLIHIVPLPDHIKFVNSVAVSSFLTNSWIWEQLAPADHVLLFQSDSIICGNSEHRVDDFIKYDFIGAPIVMAWGEGFNGGLSLRNRNMMLSIIAQSNFTAELEYNLKQQSLDENASADLVVVEDQWYYKKMIKLPTRGDGGPGARLPSAEIAATFVVQSMWTEHPLGYHQVTTWQGDNLTKIDKWCPEWRLITEGFYI